MERVLYSDSKRYYSLVLSVFFIIFLTYGLNFSFGYFDSSLSLTIQVSTSRKYMAHATQSLGANPRSLPCLRSRLISQQHMVPLGLPLAHPSNSNWMATRLLGSMEVLVICFTNLESMSFPSTDSWRS